MDVFGQQKVQSMIRMILQNVVHFLNAYSTSIFVRAGRCGIHMYCTNGVLCVDQDCFKASRELEKRVAKGKALFKYAYAGT